MTHYINPPTKVAEIGRRINGRDYRELASQLRPSERLYLLGDRLIFKFAVHAFGPDEFNEFYQQYAQGKLVTLEYFAVPESAVAA